VCKYACIAEAHSLPRYTVIHAMSSTSLFGICVRVVDGSLYSRCSSIQNGWHSNMELVRQLCSPSVTGVINVCEDHALTDDEERSDPNSGFVQRHLWIRMKR
jgi:hypothetical protein